MKALTDQQQNILEITAKILFKSFFMNFALVLFWFILFIAGNRFEYELHSKFFDVSRREYSMLHYWGIAFVKLCNIIFFLFPAIAIKMVLKKLR